MVSLFLKRTLFAAGLLLALPAFAVAQAPAADHDHAADDPAHAHDGGAEQAEINALLTEMQSVHQQLEGLQQQALADPELNAVQEALGEEIRTAMGEVDPTLGDQMARIGELEAEATAAQQAGNAQALQVLMTEAQQIQQRFMSVQQQVLEQPQIATKVSDFQTRLESKMVELDPSAEDLIVRFRELETMLNDAIGPGA